MKNLIVLVTLLFTASAMAIEIPEYLRGAKVIVTLKNGETHSYDSEKMAVVPRKTKKLAIVKKVVIVPKEKKIVEKRKDRKNRVYGLLGYGPTGRLDVSTNGSRYKTEHDKGAVLGIGYQRKLNEKLNAGFQIQTNKTFSLSLGLDF